MRRILSLMSQTIPAIRKEAEGRDKGEMKMEVGVERIKKQINKFNR